MQEAPRGTRPPVCSQPNRLLPGPPGGGGGPAPLPHFIGSGDTPPTHPSVGSGLVELAAVQLPPGGRAASVTTPLTSGRSEASGGAVVASEKEGRPSGDCYGAEFPGRAEAVAAMKAGATSMWASCCGLLNEVMGTGVVRGQQSGFPGATGPFRFTTNSDFSAYPPAAAEGPNIVCKACGLAFSVFRKKHVCCDCKKDFCSVCSISQENHRRCSTCHLLQETAFQRPQLMRLKVKDLRQYLILRNIPTDTCREKEDLVDLVLCHHGLGSEDDPDTSSLNSSRSQTSSFFTESLFSHYTAPSTTESFLGELAGRGHTSRSGALAQAQSEAAANTEDDDDEDDDEEEEEEEEEEDEDEENLEEQTSGLSQKRARASLSDLSSLEEVEGMSVRQLKEILARNFVNYSGCCEKWELVEKVNRLYKENEENQKSYGERLQLQDDEDDSLCRICMDAVIDCVLLECGHMVTCTKCGKRMSECPICRQYVVRAVHVFKS
ncbi:E3 ubiquitin-protein ligase RNF34 isoform X2 [Heterocephalus glaber]|uniref:E3 ubiquitin-protein ligase RNF34 n=1 Tax=Heterocephalus glaber TaxID=10181 RepID=A0AAX6QW81_HETGA|nr:E3 ubiquitin-protein ligase RNF34 isoform X2 [Heterocephalus glaber]